MGKNKNSVSVITLQPGVYRHFKGGEYKLIGVAVQTETSEHLVVYQQRYNDEVIFARPITMFTDEVTVDGKLVPRFAFVGLDPWDSKAN